MVALENRLINVEINVTSTVDVDKNGTFLRELGGHGHLICKYTVSYDQLQSRQKKLSNDFPVCRNYTLLF